MILRYPIAFLCAAVVSLLIFYLMQTLIETGKEALTDTPTGHVVDFVRVKQQEQVETKKRTPPKPPPPPEPPPTPETPRMERAQVSSDSEFALGAVPMETDVGLSSGMVGGDSDGEYLPILKVAPTYPRRALARGIEGYVLVEFTVTRAGNVIDPRVIEAQPPGMFEQAALDAVKKFKYKPKVVNGDAIDVAGVRNLIRFELER